MPGIVVLTDVIVPNRLFDAEVSGRSVRRNRRGENIGGFMNVNAIWSHTRREFIWKSVPQSIEVWKDLEGLFEITDAGTYGCLLIDPKDPRATHGTGKASLISGPAHTYQLLERFTFPGSSQVRNRTIKYVDAANFELKISGVTQTPITHYTLSAFTGVVTIPSDPLAANVTWSAPIYVPVHFQEDAIDWELVNGGNEAGRLVRGPRVVLQEVKKAI